MTDNVSTEELRSNIEKSIGAMLSSHGKTVASPATGTITVVDTPDVRVCGSQGGGDEGPRAADQLARFRKHAAL